MAPPFQSLFDAAAPALQDDRLDSWEAGDEKVGDMIGPYRLMEKLGEGGFGIVWRSEQTHPLRREVALKLLKRGMDSRQILARFDQERRVLAAMEHPGIATMLDAGMSPDDRPFFVMEMLWGKSITTYCQTHALPLQGKIALFRDVCAAVQHAHQKGVIHRDLKPSNILVTEVDGRPVPKIIDFGIAKALGSGGLQAITLATQAHFVLGTPQYMSPEQISDGSNVDTRSDIYALGALLYELLSGSPPFDTRTMQIKSVPDLHRIIRDQTPKRPSTVFTAFTTRQVTTPVTHGTPDASRLPADLDWITLRALEKEPQRRYQSAAEFAADLQRFLDNEPVLAHPPSTVYIVSRWIRRHHVIFAAVCLSVFGLLTGAGIALWQAKLAHEAQLRAEAAASRSQETAEFLTSMLTEVADEIKKGRNPEALRLALISSQKRLLTLSQNADLQIALVTQVAELFEGMSDRRLAAEALRQRAELVATRYGPDSPEARAAAFKHIHMIIDHGSRVDGVRMLKDLRERIVQHEGRGSAPWFNAQRLLVRTWIKMRQGHEALAVAAVTTTEARAQGLPPDIMHEVLMQHATSLEAARRYDEALAMVEECRALDTAGLHRIGIDQKQVEICLSRHDRPRAAALQRAVVDRLRALPQINPRTFLFHLRWLALIELQARRPEAAITCLDEAAAFVKKLSAAVPEGDESADTLREDMVMLLKLRIDVHKTQKQPEAALADAREAMVIARKAGNQTLLGHALASIANAHEFAGHLEEAWNTHRELYELHATHNASYKNRLEDLREMTRLRLKQNRPQGALDHAQDAWQQTLAEPSSRLEPDYLGYMAELALKAWKALHATAPSALPPAELPAWEEAVRNDPSSQ